VFATGNTGRPIKPGLGRADGAVVSVSGMRARLLLKLIGVIVLLILSVIGMRSCTGSPASSPLNPSTLLHNGVAGVCSEQQAEAEASGQTAPDTVDSAGAISQVEAGNPVGSNALAQALGGSGNMSCPTTTVGNAVGGAG
jgi:hypothetical protein